MTAPVRAFDTARSRRRPAANLAPKGDAWLAREDMAERASARAVAGRLLERLIEFHGARPPDGAAAAAVARLHQEAGAAERRTGREGRPRS